MNRSIIFMKGRRIMKKLTKLGIAVFSVVTLNAFTSTIAYADENTDSTSSAPSTVLTSNSQDLNEANPVMQPENVASSQQDNIVSDGGHVNVEGHPATLSSDGEHVTYSYTVAYQRMHSSDQMLTVSDLAIRIPNLAEAKVDFTLVGTRDENGNPVAVNAPMKVIDRETLNEDHDNIPFNLPTAEEVASGQTPYVVNNKEYDFVDSEKMLSYSIYTNFSKSQAVRVAVTLPLEEAKKIKYLAIDARMDWKSSSEGGLSGYENGSQHLEEYSSHSVYSNNDVEDLGVLANPAFINESYVRDGHLIRSVSNPKTYITPNNGDWTTIPNDTNIDEQTFFNFVRIYTLRNGSATYYVSETEDMADQDVSTLSQGDVVVDYVLKGTDRQLRDRYIDTPTLPIYGSNGQPLPYNAAENVNEQPQSLIVNGQKYVLVGLSPSSAPTSGFLKEGTTHVVYEYELAAPTPTPTPTPEPIPVQPHTPINHPQQDILKPSKNVTKETVDPTFKELVDSTATADYKQVDSGQQHLPRTGVTGSQWILSILGGLTTLLGLFLFSKNGEKQTLKESDDR